jgi:hypothetical protein
MDGPVSIRYEDGGRHKRPMADMKPGKSNLLALAKKIWGRSEIFIGLS